MVPLGSSENTWFFFLPKTRLGLKDARGLADHSAGRIDSFWQDFGGVETSMKVLLKILNFVTPGFPFPVSMAGTHIPVVENSPPRSVQSGRKLLWATSFPVLLNCPRSPPLQLPLRYSSTTFFALPAPLLTLFPSSPLPPPPSALSPIGTNP